MAAVRSVAEVVGDVVGDIVGDVVGEMAGPDVEFGEDMGLVFVVGLVGEAAGSAVGCDCVGGIVKGVALGGRGRVREVGEEVIRTDEEVENGRERYEVLGRATSW